MVSALCEAVPLSSEKLCARVAQLFISVRIAPSRGGPAVIFELYVGGSFASAVGADARDTWH